MSIVETLRGTAARVKWGQPAGHAYDAITPNLSRRIAEDDFEGARIELMRSSNENLSHTGAGNSHLAQTIIALLDRIAELQTMKSDLAVPAPSDNPDESCRETGFSSSAHFSLLTAVVIRQRSQIAALLKITEVLSSRLS